jgi:hypothetical protein
MARSLRGTLLRVETGNYVLLLGVEGVRTIPWRSVARVESAAEARGGRRQAGAERGAARPLLRRRARQRGGALREEAWADLSLGWDLRAEGVSLFKHYTVSDGGVW